MALNTQLADATVNAQAATLAASHNQLFTAHAGGTGPAIASKE